MTTTVLERTIELVPELRARAEQANADRRLPEENIKALQSSRVVQGVAEQPQRRARPRCA